MIVTLDGERLTEPLPTSGTLQALIDQVCQRLGERLIVSLTVDGRELLDQELSDSLNNPLDSVQQVDLASADRWQLAADALREVANRVSEAGREQATVADLLHAGKVSEAVNHFGEFLEAWQACQKAIAECCRLLGQDLTTLECDGQTVREHLTALADKLRELRTAFEARDMVLLVDLVQYEMPDTCQAWHRILNDMASHVAAHDAGAGS